MGSQGRQDADTIGETILAKIRTHAEGDVSDIDFSTPLSDIGIHSLELTEIIFDLEEEFGIEIEMNTAEAWEHLVTVQDMVSAVRTLVASKA